MPDRLRWLWLIGHLLVLVFWAVEYRNVSTLTDGLLIVGLFASGVGLGLTRNRARHAG